jgi:hypothetical protein
MFSINTKFLLLIDLRREEGGGRRELAENYSEKSFDKIGP